MSARQRFNPIDRTLRRLRARAVARHVPSGSRLLDVGCGLDNWLVGSGDRFRHDSLGIDPNLDEDRVDERGRRETVDEIARDQPGRFDAATSLAVIEHLPPDQVDAHLTAIRTALRPGGVLFLTTPTPRSQPVLEFLAYRLRIISADEIRDHRHYFDGGELVDLFRRNGFERVEHEHFQFGMNQRVLGRRPTQDEVTLP